MVQTQPDEIFCALFLALPSDRLSTMEKMLAPAVLDELKTNTSITQQIKKLYVGDIDIVEFLDNITDADFKYIATGLSAAQTIKNKIETSDIKKIYSTFGKWPSEISHLKVDSSKNNVLSADTLNNSDLVIKINDKKYVGISLKGKATSGAASPTLTNLSLYSIFNKLNPFIPNLQQTTDTIDREFYAEELKKFVDANPDMVAASGIDIATADITPENVKNLLNQCFKIRVLRDNIRLAFNSDLAKSNLLFSTFSTLFKNPKLNSKLAYNIFSNAYHGSTLADSDTEFVTYIVTGVGSVKKDGTLVVKPGYIADYNKHVPISGDEDDFELVYDEKIWSGDYSAAQRKFNIVDKKHNIQLLNCTLRYIGYYNSPMILSTFAPEFEHMIMVESISSLKNRIAGEETVAFVPGSFKPPTAGHWNMVQYYAKKADKVVVLISNPKTKKRLTSLGTEISPEQSQEIFEIYADKYNLSDKVEFRISESGSPVLDLIKILEGDEYAGKNIIIGVSKKDNDFSRMKSFYNLFEKTADEPLDINSDEIGNRYNLIDPAETAFTPSRQQDNADVISASFIRDNLEDPVMLYNSGVFPSKFSLTECLSIINILTD